MRGLAAIILGLAFSAGALVYACRRPVDRTSDDEAIGDWPLLCADLTSSTGTGAGAAIAAEDCRVRQAFDRKEGGRPEASGFNIRQLIKSRAGRAG